MHDVKANNLQVNNIESREEISIASQNLLRYAESLNPLNDYDLIPKWYVDTTTVGFSFIDLTSPYYSSFGGGTISITNFDDDFPILSANQIVRMQGWAEVDGQIKEFNLDPVTTRDTDGNILSASFYLLYEGTITKLKARLY